MKNKIIKITICAVMLVATLFAMLVPSMAAEPNQSETLFIDFLDEEDERVHLIVQDSYTYSNGVLQSTGIMTDDGFGLANAIDLDIPSRFYMATLSLRGANVPSFSIMWRYDNHNGWCFSARDDTLYLSSTNTVVGKLSAEYSLNITYFIDLSSFRMYYMVYSTDPSSRMSVGSFDLASTATANTRPTRRFMYLYVAPSDRLGTLYIEQMELRELPNPNATTSGSFFDLDHAYEYGYLDGYENGYVAGNDSGYDRGYDVGFGDGVDVGIGQGYASGYDDGYENGYVAGDDSGYAAGIEEGYASGYEVGYNNGYVAGDAVGNEVGYASGYYLGKTVGYEQGYSEGESNGYEYGFTDGKTEGLTEGYNNGFAEGKTEGLTEGYNNGFTEGKTEGFGEGYERGYYEGEIDGLGARQDYWYNTGHADGYDKGLKEYYNDLYEKGLENIDGNHGTGVQGFLAGMWSGTQGFMQELLDGITFSGLSLRSIVSTCLAVIIAAFIIRLLKG